MWPSTRYWLPAATPPSISSPAASHSNRLWRRGGRGRERLRRRCAISPTCSRFWRPTATPGPAPGRRLRFARSMTVDASGNVYVADAGLAPCPQSIQLILRSQPPALSFASTAVGSTSSDSPQSVPIQNIGNQPLDAVSPDSRHRTELCPGPRLRHSSGLHRQLRPDPRSSCNLSLSFDAAESPARSPAPPPSPTTRSTPTATQNDHPQRHRHQRPIGSCREVMSRAR